MKDYEKAEEQEKWKAEQKAAKQPMAAAFGSPFLATNRRERVAARKAQIAYVGKVLLKLAKARAVRQWWRSEAMQKMMEEFGKECCIELPDETNQQRMARIDNWRRVFFESKEDESKRKIASTICTCRGTGIRMLENQTFRPRTKRDDAGNWIEYPNKTFMAMCICKRGQVYAKLLGMTEDQKKEWKKRNYGWETKT